MNKITLKEQYTVPRVKDSRHDEKYFLTMDLRSGYYEIPVDEYRSNRLLIRLCNAMALFQNVMNLIPKVGVVSHKWFRICLQNCWRRFTNVTWTSWNFVRFWFYNTVEEMLFIALGKKLVTLDLKSVQKKLLQQKWTRECITNF